MSVKLWFDEMETTVGVFCNDWAKEFADEGDEVNVLGKQIKMLRTIRGWTQEELGKRLGVSKVAVCSYEHGLQVPNVEMLNKLADLFEVTVDYLLGRHEDCGVSETEREMIAILRRLPEKQTRILLEFARFLRKQSAVREQVG